MPTLCDLAGLRLKVDGFDESCVLAAVLQCFSLLNFNNCHIPNQSNTHGVYQRDHRYSKVGKKLDPFSRENNLQLSLLDDFHIKPVILRDFPWLIATFDPI